MDCTSVVQVLHDVQHLHQDKPSHVFTELSMLSAQAEELGAIDELHDDVHLIYDDLTAIC